jgi:hypothetical protein
VYRRQGWGSIKFSWLRKRKTITSCLYGTLILLRAAEEAVAEERE